MKSRHPALVLVAMVCTVLVLPSCGGGGATYSSSAYAACLSREGASTFDMGVLPTKQKAALVGLGSHAFVGARFADGETDGFAFAADASAAKEIQGKVSSPLATPGVVKVDGNMVLFVSLHSAAGVQKIISSCKADARLS